MINIAITQLKKHSHLVVFAFFAVYLLIGLSIYDDYGVSTDEITENETAILNLDYITGKSDELLNYPDRHYGAVLTIPLYLIGQAVSDPRTDYLVRHLTTFLIFYSSAIVFYLIAGKLKISKTAALLGTAMYIFHPHIFSHSFYNIKDIPFLALYLFNLYTLLRWTEKPNFRGALAHGFLSGMLVIFRLPGLLMWAITFMVWLWMLALEPRAWKKFILIGAAYATAAIATLFIFLPILWHDPIGEARSFFSLELFVWGGEELFMGRFLTPEHFPRYYLPVYMLVTTPMVFTAFLTIGTLFAFRDLFIRRELFTHASLPKILLLVSLYFPMLYIMAARPIIYNGWRHVFFIYAPFALLAAIGIDELWKWVARWNLTALRRGAQLSILLAFGIQAIWLATFLVLSHPYQHVYYNRLAGKTLTNARINYSMDYWGLAYRGALEKILRGDDRPLIRVTVASNHLIIQNLNVMLPSDRARFVVVGPEKDPDYYLTHYRYEFVDTERYRELWGTVDVLGVPINGIYKYIDQPTD